MRSLIGPIILFFVGLFIWLFDWPDSTLDYVLMWAGVIAMIAALIWAVMNFSGYGRRSRL